MQSKRDKYYRWIILMIVLLILTISVAVFVQYQLAKSLADKPCMSIPRSFMLNHPECTNKLLLSLNVTNVRIDTVNSRSDQRVVR